MENPVSMFYNITIRGNSNMKKVIKKYPDYLVDEEGNIYSLK